MLNKLYDEVMNDNKFLDSVLPFARLLLINIILTGRGKK